MRILCCSYQMAPWLTRAKSRRSPTVNSIRTACGVERQSDLRAVPLDGSGHWATDMCGHGPGRPSCLSSVCSPIADVGSPGRRLVVALAALPGRGARKSRTRMTRVRLRRAQLACPRQASALSAAFVRHWGPRIPPWLERPLCLSLREAADYARIASRRGSACASISGDVGQHSSRQCSGAAGASTSRALPAQQHAMMVHVASASLGCLGRWCQMCLGLARRRSHVEPSFACRCVCVCHRER